jgi:PHP domain-containing protein
MGLIVPALRRAVRGRYPRRVGERHDLAGVIHLHTRYSDGTGSVADVVRAASANGLDYLLLTDHDTLAARDRGEEGWHGDVLMLVGEEVSPYRRNHYLAFGLERPIDHRDLTPQEIVNRVNEAGGFGFLSHPFSKGSERFSRGGRGMPWGDLDAEGYTGLELWSFVTDTAERVNSIRDLLRFIAAPGHFIDHPPARNLELWEDICARRRCVALGGVDAHQIGIRVGNRVPLRLMAYKRSFKYLRTHLLADHPLTGSLNEDRELVYTAMRAGHAYIAIDALAPAKGFRFWAEGDHELEQGDEAPAYTATLRARAPHQARLRLLRNGREIAGGPALTSLEHEVHETGVYRVEAYLEAHGRERTWILSNPIYLR